MSCIAFISNYFPALSETFMYKEVQGLRERGLRIKTFSIRKPGTENVSKESLDLRDSTTYLLPLDYCRFIKAHLYYFIRNPFQYLGLFLFLMRRKFKNRLKDRVRTFFHFGEAVYFAGLIKADGEITHIHAHYASHPATVALIASRLTKIPFSFTAHAYDIVIDKLFIKEKVNAARFVITCTKYGRHQVLANNGIADPKKVVTIYHGVDAVRFKPRDNTATRHRPTLLNIGRLSEEKAQANLIRACRLLKDQGYEFRCYIVGDGPLYAYLRERIIASKLENVITLAGRILHDDIDAYYKKADIYVQPSVRDNLPNVLLESQAMGLPVVATDICGIPELITNGVNGLLVSPGNIEELADAIKLLINDPAYAKKLAQNGRRSVCKNFDTQNSLDAIVNLYRFRGVIEK